MTSNLKTISDKGIATAFELLLEEIEEVADELNRRGADAFERGQHNEVEALLTDARAYAAFQSKVRDLRSEWRAMHPEPGVEPEPEPAKPPISKKDLGRLNRGLRTPDELYRLPLLEALIELGGSGQVQAVTDLVGKKMAGILNDYDREPLPSDGTTLRWRNTVAWMRNTLVEEGLLRNGSKRGTWEISDAGREAAKNNGHPVAKERT